MYSHSGYKLRPEDMSTMSRPTGILPAMGPMVYQDHGDGYGEYSGLDQFYKDDPGISRTQERPRGDSKYEKRYRSPSPSDSDKSRSSTKSPSRSRSLSDDGKTKIVKYRQASVLDAFRIMYLTPSTHKNSTTKYLSTKKKQDRIQEQLKRDGLGSKKWLFYPRPEKSLENAEVKSDIVQERENCDQRIKVDARFLRKYKKNKSIDSDAPIAKLKRWELILYKKFGFIQPV